MVLRAEAVSRHFIRQQKTTNFFYAVRDVTLELKAGELTEITGRSGSGKSTLLNILAGLLEPDNGRVMLDETDLYALDDVKRSELRHKSFGIIPQGQTALSSLTVMENIMLPAALEKGGARQLQNPEIIQYANELMENVGILSLADAHPRELSGGEMRRMAIARARIMHPSVLMADEPTGDLDDENTQTVLKLLRECADEGAAVLLVTHEKEAAAFADRVFRMDNGILKEE